MGDRSDETSPFYVAADQGGVYTYQHDLVAGATDPGKDKSRSENQDALWPAANIESVAPGSARPDEFACLIGGRLYVVADGVSGGLEPKIASELAARTIGETYYELVRNRIADIAAGWPALSELAEMLRQAILNAHLQLQVKSDDIRAELPPEQRTNTNYLETTCACILLRGRDVVTGHVGDSPIELWRNDLERLETLVNPHLDQTDNPSRLLGAELALGDIEMHRSDDWPNSLLAGGVRDDDVLIACTDGLSKFLPNRERAQVMQQYHDDLHLAAQLLIAQARANQIRSSDNISVILLAATNPLEVVNEHTAARKALEYWVWNDPERMIEDQAVRLRLGADYRGEAQRLLAGGAAGREASKVWLRKAAILGDSLAGGWLAALTAGETHHAKTESAAALLREAFADNLEAKPREWLAGIDESLNAAKSYLAALRDKYPQLAILRPWTQEASFWLAAALLLRWQVAENASRDDLERARTYLLELSADLKRTGPGDISSAYVSDLLWRVEAALAQASGVAPTMGVSESGMSRRAEHSASWSGASDLSSASSDPPVHVHKLPETAAMSKDRTPAVSLYGASLMGQDAQSKPTAFQIPQTDRARRWPMSWRWMGLIAVVGLVVVLGGMIWLQAYLRASPQIAPPRVAPAATATRAIVAIAPAATSTRARVVIAPPNAAPSVMPSRTLAPAASSSPEPILRILQPQTTVHDDGEVGQTRITLSALIDFDPQMGVIITTTLPPGLEIVSPDDLTNEYRQETAAGIIEWRVPAGAESPFDLTLDLAATIPYAKSQVTHDIILSARAATAHGPVAADEEMWKVDLHGKPAIDVSLSADPIRIVLGQTQDEEVEFFVNLDNIGQVALTDVDFNLTLPKQATLLSVSPETENRWSGGAKWVHQAPKVAPGTGQEYFGVSAMAELNGLTELAKLDAMKPADRTASVTVTARTADEPPIVLEKVGTVVFELVLPGYVVYDSKGQAPAYSGFPNQPPVRELKAKQAVNILARTVSKVVKGEEWLKIELPTGGAAAEGPFWIRSRNVQTNDQLMKFVPVESAEEAL